MQFGSLGSDSFKETATAVLDANMIVFCPETGN